MVSAFGGNEFVFGRGDGERLGGRWEYSYNEWTGRASILLCLFVGIHLLFTSLLGVCGFVK